LPSQEEVTLKIRDIIWYVDGKTNRRTFMPSLSKKTELKRKRKKAAQNPKRKKIQSKASTPVFPVHVDKE
jgi:hypothetical protein